MSLKALQSAYARAMKDFLEQFIAEANELATGEKYEGLLDEDGSVPEEEAESETEAVTE